MDEVGVIKTLTFSLFGKFFTFNPNTVIMTVIVMGVIFTIFYLLSRNISRIPSRKQMFLELIIDSFDELVRSSMGNDHRKYFPIIMSIFLFVLFSNWIGAIPNVLGFLPQKDPYEFALKEFGKKYEASKLVDAISADGYGLTIDDGMNSVDKINNFLKTSAFYEAWNVSSKKISDPEIDKLAQKTVAYRNEANSHMEHFKTKYIMRLNRMILERSYPELCPPSPWGIPGHIKHFEMAEPTKDLNTTMGLALVVFLITHFSGVFYKGLKHYIWEFFQPIPLLFPLNVIGELGKFVSLFFRLFGNIFGGGVIIVVGYSMLAKGFTAFAMPFLGPIFILYFVLFAGLIQAFVFTMLSMTFIAGAKN